MGTESKRLSWRLRVCNRVKPERSGIGPEIWFLKSSRTVSSVRVWRLGGRVPRIPLLLSWIRVTLLLASHCTVGHLQGLGLDQSTPLVRFRLDLRACIVGPSTLVCEAEKFSEERRIQRMIPI